MLQHVWAWQLWVVATSIYYGIAYFQQRKPQPLAWLTTLDTCIAMCWLAMFVLDGFTMWEEVGYHGHTVRLTFVAHLFHR